MNSADGVDTITFTLFSPSEGLDISRDELLSRLISMYIFHWDPRQVLV